MRITFRQLPPLLRLRLLRGPTRPVVSNSRSQVRRTTKSTGRHTIILPSRSRSARLHKLLHGLRTPSQRKSLERIAGIIDTFNWKSGTRNDFLNRYIGNNVRFYVGDICTTDKQEYLASGWPAVVNAHGKRLRRYSEGFREMYPPKKRKVPDTMGPRGVDVKAEL